MTTDRKDYLATEPMVHIACTRGELEAISHYINEAGWLGQHYNDARSVLGKAQDGLRRLDKAAGLLPSVPSMNPRGR